MAFSAPSKYRKSSLKDKVAQPFTPWQQPTSPPPGFYDPALDSAERAAQRGYTDLQQDVEQGQERANTGLATNSQRLTQDYNTGNERASQDYSASLADLLKSRSRGTEDYNFQTGERGRQYANLGNQQTQSGVNQGITGGGALAASRAARTANQSREQGQADLGYGRAMQDSAGSEARLNQSFARRMADATTNYGRGVEDLGQGYQYNADDAATQQARAGRELGFFGQDNAEQKFFQANQSGWDAGAGKPSNEFSDAQGPYRVIMRGNKKVRVRPNGSTF